MMLAAEEFGNEFCICGVALVTAKFLFAIGFDSSGIDEMERGDFGVVERFGDRFSVGAGLFEASCELRKVGEGLKPCEQILNTGITVIEFLGMGFSGNDEVAVEVIFSDINAEKEGWCGGSD